MSEFDKNIKKKNELIKYLERSFIIDAAEVFLKKHSKIKLDKRLIDEESLKYSAFATRIWLNYLDNEQFKKILKKRLKTDNSFYNDNVDFIC